MIMKRLAAVITVRCGIAVQSFGYARHLPMGDPAVVAHTLDRWGADEIILNCIDRQPLGPDYALLERIGRLGLATPLIYAGGIRSHAEGVRVVKLGADRVAVDALLRDRPDEILALSESLGAQGIIAALPVSLAGGKLLWRDYRRRTDEPFSATLLETLSAGRISEALLIDWQNEGSSGGFDAGIIDAFPVATMPVIAFGGANVPPLMCRLLGNPAVAAVAVGNSLSWREHAVQRLKADLAGLPVRHASYAGSEVRA
jgi:imidazole glycerol-phosphate synthase subunit HisF